MNLSFRWFWLYVLRYCLTNTNSPRYYIYYILMCLSLFSGFFPHKAKSNLYIFICSYMCLFLSWKKFHQLPLLILHFVVLGRSSSEDSYICFQDHQKYVWIHMFTCWRRHDGETSTFRIHQWPTSVFTWSSSRGAEKTWIRRLTGPYRRCIWG